MKKHLDIIIKFEPKENYEEGFDLSIGVEQEGFREPTKKELADSLEFIVKHLRK